MVKYLLSLDGGGVKGVIALQVLSMIEKTYDIKISNCFDMFAGTSTGGLIACLMAYRGMSIDEIFDKAYTVNNLRTIMSSTIYSRWFSNLQFWPKYSDKGKLEVITRCICGDDDIIGQPTTEVAQKEEEEVVKHTIFDVKKSLLVTSYDPQYKKPIFFRNYFDNTYNYRLVDICNSTSAAPTYFPAASVLNLTTNETKWFVDGGLCANNPVNMAYLDMKRLYPDEKIKVLSVGTGIYKSNYGPSDKNIGGVEWLVYDNIISILLDGNQVMSHLCAKNNAEENGDEYLRINDFITIASTKMDDTSDTNYENMKKEGMLWWNNNKSKLDAFFS
jgi:patatin-like phospholipase/acyl hydrolase